MSLRKARRVRVSYRHPNKAVLSLPIPRIFSPSAGASRSVGVQRAVSGASLSVTSILLPSGSFSHEQTRSSGIGSRGFRIFPTFDDPSPMELATQLYACMGRVLLRSVLAVHSFPPTSTQPAQQTARHTIRQSMVSGAAPVFVGPLCLKACG